MKKYKFVNNLHISLKENEVCRKKHCENAHLWFNKRAGMERYAVSFINLSNWGVGSWCIAKEVCIPKDNLIEEIISRLKEQDVFSISLSKEFFEEIFGDCESTENWKLHLW